MSKLNMKSYTTSALAFARICFCCIMIAFIMQACKSNKAAVTDTVSVQKRSIKSEVIFSAKVLPFNASSQYADVNGVVVSIEKLPGSKVAKGEVIAHVRDKANQIHTIVSNADGMLLSVNFSQGEHVEASQTFYIVGETERKLISGELDEIDAKKIAIGQPFTVQVDDSTFLQGKISYVNNVGTEVNGLVRFKVAGQVDDPGNSIGLFGISIPVRVELAKADNVLTVEKKALITRGNKHFLKLEQGGKSVEKEISTGIENENYIQVTNGVNENDKVLIGNNIL